MGTVIQTIGLTMKFGNLTAVDNLSFGVNRHEIFCLLGPNGAGKTTTIRMICGLLPPTSGTIRTANGKPLKSQIGYCPQENIFYPKLTCFEQHVFIGQMHGCSLKELKIRADHLLEMLGLKDKMHTRAAKLSGGMQRRLNICLALIHSPEILILHEPEAGLNPQSRIMVRDFIRNFGKEKTVLIASLTSLSIIAFSLILAAATRTAREILVVGNFPMFLFMFFTGAAFPIRSNALFTVAGYPVNLQGIMSPTHATTALNKILIMKMDLGSVLPEIISILVLTVLYFIIGALLFRKRHLKMA